MLPSYIATGHSSDGTNGVSLKYDSVMRIESALLINVGSSGETQLIPTYGANALGDLFLAQVFVRNIVVPLSTPEGWTLWAGPNTLGNSSHYWLARDARSSGGEEGGVAFLVTANCAIASIHTFRDVALEDFFESLSNNGSAINTDPFLAPAVVADGPDRLAVAVGGAGEALTPSVFTGQTGGTWVLNHATSSLIGSNGVTWLQTADLPAPGAISGGSFSVTPENYSQQGFALIGA